MGGRPLLWANAIIMGNRFKRMGKLNVVMGKLKAIGRNLSIKLKVGGKVNFRRMSISMCSAS